LQNPPKFTQIGILVWNYTIWQPCIQLGSDRSLYPPPPLQVSRTLCFALNVFVSDGQTLNCPTAICLTSNRPTSGCPTSGCPTSNRPNSLCPTANCLTSNCPNLWCPTSGCPTLLCLTANCLTSNSPNLWCQASGCQASGCPTSGCPTAANRRTSIEKKWFEAYLQVRGQPDLSWVV
jgi:hypothetical protein